MCKYSSNPSQVTVEELKNFIFTRTQVDLLRGMHVQLGVDPGSAFANYLSDEKQTYVSE